MIPKIYAVMGRLVSRTISLSAVNNNHCLKQRTLHISHTPLVLCNKLIILHQVKVKKSIYNSEQNYSAVTIPQRPFLFPLAPVTPTPLDMLPSLLPLLNQNSPVGIFTNDFISAISIYFNYLKSWPFSSVCII